MKRYFLLALFISVPIGARERVKNTRNAHPFIIASIPKCGSFMIRKCVQGLVPHAQTRPPRGGYFHIRPENVQRNHHIFSHAPYREEYAELLKEGGYKVLLMVRDPRDQAVSFVHFTKKHSKWWSHLSGMPLDDILTTWIKDASVIHTSGGVFHSDMLKNLGNISTFFEQYEGWMQHPETYVVHFEKLVGPNGGGTREAQLEEIRNIANHLGVEADDARIEEVADNLFGKSRTFRKGQISSWSEEFTEEQKNLFKGAAGQLLINWGYETDLDW